MSAEAYAAIVEIPEPALDRHATYPATPHPGAAAHRRLRPHAAGGLGRHRHAPRLPRLVRPAVRRAVHHPFAAGLLAHLPRTCAAGHERRGHRPRGARRLDPDRGPAPDPGLGHAHDRGLRRARARGLDRLHADHHLRDPDAGAARPAEGAGGRRGAAGGRGRRRRAPRAQPRQPDPFNAFLGIRVAGFFDDRASERLEGMEGEKVLGSVAQLADYVKKNRVDMIYVTLPMASQPRIVKLLEELHDTTASVYFTPDIFLFDLINARMDTIGGIPVLAVCETPFCGMNGLVKRVSDIVLSTLILIGIAPLLAAIAVGVKLSSPG